MGMEMILRIALVACLFFSCGGNPHSPGEGRERMKIEKALEKHTGRLMAIPGVEGVGVGGTEQAPAIVVMVRSGATQKAKELPLEIEGYPVIVESTGEIQAY